MNKESIFWYKYSRFAGKLIKLVEIWAKMIYNEKIMYVN